MGRIKFRVPRAAWEELEEAPGDNSSEKIRGALGEFLPRAPRDFARDTPGRRWVRSLSDQTKNKAAEVVLSDSLRAELDEVAAELGESRTALILRSVAERLYPETSEEQLARFRKRQARAAERARLARGGSPVAGSAGLRRASGGWRRGQHS